MDINTAPIPKKLLPLLPECEIIEELQGGHAGERHALIMLTPSSVKQQPTGVNDGGQGDKSWPVNASELWHMSGDSSYEPHTLPAASNSGRECYICSLCFRQFNRAKAVHGHMKVHSRKRKARSPIILHTNKTSTTVKDMNATAVAAATSYKKRVLVFAADAGYMASTAAPNVSAWKHKCGNALGGHKRNHYPRLLNRKDCSTPISNGCSIDMVLTGETQQKLQTKTLCTNESAATIAALMVSSSAMETHPAEAPSTTGSAVRSIRLFGSDIIICPEAE